jgi:hypothetical protein
MYHLYMRKLKPDRWPVGALPVLVSLVSAVVALILFGLTAALVTLALFSLVFALFQAIAYVRTRNSGYLWSVAHLVFLTLFFASVPEGPLWLGAGLTRLTLTMAVIFGSGTLYLALTRRLKWRGREIFELAAMPVADIQDGFTERPRPIGKVECTRGEILEFAEFIRSNLIAMSYPEASRVVFMPIKMGQEFAPVYGWNYNYRTRTWIAFDFDGNVSVRISAEDYLDYHDQLSFDQLCDSLGRLFIEFFESFRSGEGLRVIERMDALRVPIFS